jgi:ribosomal protein S18 acetylase RimI-like enzyme
VKAETDHPHRSEAAAVSCTLRPVDDARDAQFLSTVYASTRDDLAMTGLPAEQLRMLIAMQQRAQEQYYRANYPAAEHHIVCFDDEDIGRLIVERRGDELTLVDIALLPGSRGRGIGGALLRDLIDEATSSRRAFVLHVIKTNRAINLYTRLGFEITGDLGVYYRMEWQPRSADTTA